MDLVDYQNCLRLGAHEAHIYPKVDPKHYCLGRIWHTPGRNLDWNSIMSCEDLRKPHEFHTHVRKIKGVGYEVVCPGWKESTTHEFMVETYNFGIRHKDSPYRNIYIRPPIRPIAPELGPNGEAVGGDGINWHVRPGNIMVMPEPSPSPDAKMIASVIRDEAKKTRKHMSEELKKLAQALMTPTIVETEMEN
jgi:hypothetical protein